MNAPALFVNAQRNARIAAGACILLSGCMGGPFNAQVDPRSPVAGEVGRAARENTTYPTFADIPPKPIETRPLKEFGQAARELEAARLKLEAATAPSTWTLEDTEAFAERARAAAGPELEPATAPNTEAFADELRRRATPPPPPQP